ncbi:hypothetical protein [Halorussus pelagicus]|uniref:hypothetical protein n=1 Tax=Halorussus pelagicus TaxID=2505977 RepID=UPI000FFB1B2E|nr:hypothetical protein [Halorussus pelagicus]
MTVTANCYKEIQSGKDNREKPFPYRNGAKTAYEYVSEYENWENIALYPAPGSPPYNQNNGGEKSIRIALFTTPDTFDTVVGYDDDLGPVLRRVRERGIEFDVVPPNEPLYFLYRKERLTKEEFCVTTRNIIDEQGWRESSNADLFWQFPVDCHGFR